MSNKREGRKLHKNGVELESRAWLAQTHGFMQQSKNKALETDQPAALPKITLAAEAKL